MNGISQTSAHNSVLIVSLFLAFSLPLEIRLFTKSNLVHKTVRKPQNSLVPSHCAALGSNLAELFALEIKWMKIKMHRQQFQTLLSKITLATLRRAPPAIWRLHRAGALAL